MNFLWKIVHICQSTMSHYIFSLKLTSVFPSDRGNIHLRAVLIWGCRWSIFLPIYIFAEGCPSKFICLPSSGHSPENWLGFLSLQWKNCISWKRKGGDNDRWRIESEPLVYFCQPHNSCFPLHCPLVLVFHEWWILSKRENVLYSGSAWILSRYYAEVFSPHIVFITIQ